MGRAPCPDDHIKLKRGPWTPEEDEKLTSFIQKHGHGNWRTLPRAAGLNRCGKSCRLRWTNYLRPDIKRGPFSQQEEDLIIKLHHLLGNKWSRIATFFHGRTDNEIKNYWNTRIRKKLLQMGIDPVTHKRREDLEYFLSNLSQLLSASRPNSGTPSINTVNNTIAKLLEPNMEQVTKQILLQNIFQILNTVHHIPGTSSMDQSTPSYLGFDKGNTSPEIQVEFCQVPNHVSELSFETSNDNGTKRSSISCLYNDNNTLDEYGLPSSTNVSEISTINQSVAGTNSIYESPPLLAGGNVFEGLEKLLNDGNGDSFWKHFVN